MNSIPNAHRRLAVLVVLAVVGAGLMGAGTAGAGASAAASAECTWKRHAKRVVRHVWRHGEHRRVVRVRRWWTCVPPSGAVPVTPAPPTPPASEPEANRLGVKAAEFYFTLSRPQVKAGEVTIELNNRGEDAHNLNLQLEGGTGPVFSIPETGSLGHDSAEFDLPAGTYKLWCSLPEHEEKGMSTSLVVSAG